MQQALILMQLFACSNYCVLSVNTFITASEEIIHIPKTQQLWKQAHNFKRALNNTVLSAVTSCSLVDKLYLILRRLEYVLPKGG
jgi:hypothetical protein